MKDGLSKENQELATKLFTAESEIDADLSIPGGNRARLYTCLAHDHYQMDMEEEGQRLLLKADKVYPGYFSSLMRQHTKENKNFDTVVKNLTLELVWLLLSKIGEIK